MILCGRKKKCLSVFPWVNEESNDSSLSSHSPSSACSLPASMDCGLLGKHGSPAPYFIDSSRTVSAVMSFLIAQLNYTGLCAWLKRVKKQIYWLDKKSYWGLRSLPILAVRIKHGASPLPSWVPTHHSRVSYLTSPSSSHNILTQLGCDVSETLSMH